MNQYRVIIKQISDKFSSPSDMDTESDLELT